MGEDGSRRTAGRLLVSGVCAVCGEVRPLTFEHLPARSLGNRGPGIAFTGDHYVHALTRGRVPLMGDGYRDGSGKIALCRKCNADTARWYLDEYKAWCVAAGRALRELPLVLPCATWISTFSPRPWRYRTPTRSPSSSRPWR